MEMRSSGEASRPKPRTGSKAEFPQPRRYHAAPPTIICLCLLKISHEADVPVVGTGAGIVTGTLLL